MVGEFRIRGPEAAGRIAVAHHAELLRVEPAHEGRPRRPADGKLAIGARKTDTFGGKPIKIRRPHGAIAVAAKAGREVVADNQQNVPLLRRRG